MQQREEDGKIVIGVTGHRNLYHNEEDIKNALRKLFTTLSIRSVITGMAIGFDQLVARVCLEMNIPFIAAVPFATQAIMWPKKAQEEYLELLSKAERVEIVSGGEFANYKFHHRNKWIVDNCHYLIAYLFEDLSASGKQKKSGTQACWDYAGKVKKPRDILVIEN